MAIPQLLSLWLAAAFAAEVNGPAARLPAVPALFAAPAAEWSQPLPSQTVSPIEAALARLAANGLAVPNLRADLSAHQRLRTLAPVLDQLGGLHLDAAKFAAETPRDQEAAVELALHAARDDVSQKAYELAGQAKALVWSQNAVDKGQRDELYRVAWQLGEITRYYLEFVPAEERDFIAQTEIQARARFHDVQKALVDGTALPAADALIKGTGGRGGDSAVEAASKPQRKILGTTNARKLLEDMRNSKSGWSQGDFKALYTGFGFVAEEGGNHTKYKHPLLPSNQYATVARHNDLAPGYAQSAVKLIDELQRIVNGPELPASAISESREVPPLPPPGEEAAATPAEPKSIVAVETPLEIQRGNVKSPGQRPNEKPAPAVAVAAARAASPTLAPATPHADDKKPETPAPSIAVSKDLPKPHDLLGRLRRLLGLKD